LEEFKKAVLTGFNANSAVQNEYSPNNIKRVILSENGCIINYHITTTKNTQKAKAFIFKKGEPFNKKSLDVLITPRVHSSIEEIIFDNMDHNLIMLFTKFIEMNSSKFVRLSKVYHTNVGLDGFMGLFSVYGKELSSFSSDIEVYLNKESLYYSVLLKKEGVWSDTFLRPQYYAIDGGKLGKYFKENIERGKALIKDNEAKAKLEEKIIKTFSEGEQLLKRYSFDEGFVNALDKMSSLPVTRFSLYGMYNKKYFENMVNDALSANIKFNKKAFNSFISSASSLGLVFSPLDFLYSSQIAEKKVDGNLDPKCFDSFLEACKTVGRVLLKVYLKIALKAVTEWGMESVKVKNQVSYYNLYLVSNKSISNSLKNTRTLSGEVSSVSEKDFENWQKVCKIVGIEEGILGTSDINKMLVSIKDNLLEVKQ
jgi:hypothetical protein